MVSFVRNRIVFYGEALKSAQQVGAFSATSRAVAEAVVRPIVRRGEPLRVLEVGAGTGVVSQAILRRLGPGDHLDVCEVNPKFARLLREQFEGRPGATVAIHELDVEELARDVPYDAVVSTLPLMNFAPEKVERVFARMLGMLRPDGVLTYYDYWAKHLRCLVTTEAAERRRMKAVLRVTQAFLDRHEFETHVIPWNVPPAKVHYLRPR